MRQKELRIGLVCYGGISLAVYMHGVTKELWKLSRASRSFLAGETCEGGVESVYRRLLERAEHGHGLRLRVLTDIIAGASAGGINGVFLAQAIHSGQSLEPLTRMWLERCDVDDLLDPDARPWSRFAKFWAQPLVSWVLRRPGNVVSESVAKETRAEVRGKLSRLIRSRWFEPPFGGLGFSKLLAGALDAMAASETGAPLLPPGHPIDLFVTATDFKGHLESLRLHSPPHGAGKRTPAVDRFSRGDARARGRRAGIHPRADFCRAGDRKFPRRLPGAAGGRDRRTGARARRSLAQSQRVPEAHPAPPPPRR